MFLPKMENELVKCFEREDWEISFGHIEFKMPTGYGYLWKADQDPWLDER